LFIFLIKTNKNNKNNIIFVILLFYLFNNNIILTNINSYLNNLILNKELYNGLLIIHPIMTYITIVFYLNIFNNEKNIFLKNLNKIKKNLIKKNVIKYILIAFSAMVLGSC
jgi:hypothetical protein